LYTIPLHLSIK